MTPNKTITEALRDKALLGAALGNPATWITWLVVLQAAFGLELDAVELELFASVAGSRKPPTKRVRELWCVIARRGGKSRMAALIACYLALFVKHRLSPGERGMVLVLSASVTQSRTVYSYILDDRFRETCHMGGIQLSFQAPIYAVGGLCDEGFSPSYS